MKPYDDGRTALILGRVIVGRLAPPEPWRGRAMQYVYILQSLKYRPILCGLQ